MNSFLLSVLLLIAIGVNVSQCAVARQEAKIGDRVVISFGQGMLVVKRQTSANPQPQYIFALGEAMNGWTTNGDDRINSSPAKLFFNGTLVIEKIAKSDFGSYEAPMEEPAEGLAKSLYELSEKN